MKRYCSQDEMLELEERARRGDPDAARELLESLRPGLRHVVSVRLSPTLVQRFDPSDIVQDVMLEAHQRMPEWLETSETSVHACLYRCLRDRLARVHRDHIHRSKRSVRREITCAELSDESVVALARRFLTDSTSPSRHVMRKERTTELREALSMLQEAEREILVMRALEGLSVQQVGEILSISVSAVKMRYLRALQRMQKILEHPPHGG